MPTTATTFTYNPELLYVPGSIADIPTYLRTQNWTQRQIEDHQDKVAFVLNRLVTAPVYDASLRHDDFVNLSYNLLVNVIGARYVPQILDMLKSTDVVETDGKYWNGDGTGKCMGYRVTSTYQSKPVGLLIYKQETLGKKLWDRRQDEETQLKTKDRFLNRIHRDMKQIRIDYTPAQALNTNIYDQTDTFLVERRHQLSVTKISKTDYAALLDEAIATNQYIQLPSRKEMKKVLVGRQVEAPETTVYSVLKSGNLASYSSNLVALEKLRDQDLRVPTRPIKGSRVYTALTNLGSAFRQFLFHAKQPAETLVNIDIKNSQPFLLCIMLADKYRGHQLPVDVQHYMSLTSSGAFYEHVAQAMGVHMRSKRERREFKQAFFASLFFCKNQHTEASQTGKWFKQHFPNVYQLIYDTKFHRYQDLADAMQTVEASVIIDDVLASLHTKKVWAATIHDSVICLADDAHDVMETMLAAFQAKAGLVPSLDVEALRKS